MKQRIAFLSLPLPGSQEKLKPTVEWQRDRSASGPLDRHNKTIEQSRLKLNYYTLPQQ